MRWSSPATCSRQRPFGPGHGAGIRPVIRGGRQERTVWCPGFLSSFGAPAFAC
jgi:hypothetical protein